MESQEFEDREAIPRAENLLLAGRTLGRGSPHWDPDEDGGYGKVHFPSQTRWALHTKHWRDERKNQNSCQVHGAIRAGPGIGRVIEALRQDSDRQICRAHEGHADRRSIHARPHIQPPTAKTCRTTSRTSDGPEGGLASYQRGNSRRHTSHRTL